MDDGMSKARFTVAYDGEALRDGSMDVRDLAPALLAIGQLFDAANTTLNGEQAKIAVNVQATNEGSFQIVLEVLQTWGQQAVALLSGDEVTAAIHLRDLLFMGAGGVGGLFWAIKKLRGHKPDRVERVNDEYVRLVFGDDDIVVPMRVLRLYQDLAVRAAAERVVEPLRRPGIEKFEARENGEPAVVIEHDDVDAFDTPEADEEELLDDVRRSAFSIVSLAFKDDNKWRLHDGNTQISATIADEDFLRRVNANEIAFAKGDALICEVRVRQTQSAQGLKTEYTVERVIEHKPAPRQLRLEIEPSPTPPDNQDEGGPA